MFELNLLGMSVFLVIICIFLTYYPREEYLVSNDWSNVNGNKKRKTIDGVEVRVLPKGHILEGEKGVFATKHFSQYDIIGEYTGVVKKESTADEKNRYLFTLTDDLIVDAQKYGNELRFVNGNMNIAEEPNVKSSVCYIGGLPRVLYICINDIEPGDEILVDYGNDYNESFLS